MTDSSASSLSVVLPAASAMLATRAPISSLLNTPSLLASNDAIASAARPFISAADAALAALMDPARSSAFSSLRFCMPRAASILPR
eukprot:scaffold74646_cov66-Phaeocystis_antarctica.AAC.4